ncbi:MAG: hypothetical protein WC450_00055 [Candidatus Omnitrophota bacterium]|jgi:hypothetical protein
MRNTPNYQKTALVFFCAAALGLTASSAVFAKTQDERAQLVDKELSCISKVKSRQGAFTWDDVCYLEDDSASGSSPKSVNVTVDANGGVTVEKQGAQKSIPPQKKAVAGQPQKDEESDALTDEDIDIMEADLVPDSARLVQGEDSDNMGMSVMARDRKKLSFEFGPESFYYEFDSDDGNSRVGTLFGAFAALTYHLGPEEDLARDHSITMVKLDTHLAQDVDAFVLDGRGLAGFDFIRANNTRFTPYLGIGYRYLRDKDAGDSQAIDDIYGSYWFYTNGARGLKEEFKYIYIPVGIEINRPILDRWAVQLNAEFDFILQGRSTRHYNDLGPLIVSADDGSTHIPNKMEFDHDKGYGWRFSLKFLRSAEEVDIFIEPFIRFWKLDDSDIEQFRTDGTATIWQYVDTGEPVIDQVRGHEITEYGFKAGVLY